MNPFCTDVSISRMLADNEDLSDSELADQGQPIGPKSTLEDSGVDLWIPTSSSMAISSFCSLLLLHEPRHLSLAILGYHGVGKTMMTKVRVCVCGVYGSVIDIVVRFPSSKPTNKFRIYTIGL